MLQDLNWIDILIGLFLIISLVQGIKAGLIKSIFTITGIAAGLLVAIVYYVDGSRLILDFLTCLPLWPTPLVLSCFFRQLLS